jgi:hypothetical protein
MSRTDFGVEPTHLKEKIFSHSLLFGQPMDLSPTNTVKRGRFSTIYIGINISKKLLFFAIEKCYNLLA